MIVVLFDISNIFYSIIYSFSSHWIPSCQSLLLLLFLCPCLINLFLQVVFKRLHGVYFLVRFTRYISLLAVFFKVNLACDQVNVWIVHFDLVLWGGLAP